MSSLSIHAIDDAHAAGSIELNDQVFSQNYNEPLIHQLVVTYLAGERQGTKAQKNRSSVSGGGIKPWRQKGTGRARSGTSRSPIWRKGGVTFAATNRSYSKKLNKKMYRQGLRSIFSELVRQNRLTVTTVIELEQPKTKVLLSKLSGLIEGNVLLIDSMINEALYLSARNIPNLLLTDLSGLNPVALLNADKVIVSERALKDIEARLS